MTIRLADLPILTMECRPCPPRAHPGRVAEWAVHMTWPQGYDLPDFPTEVAPSPVIGATVDGGRWIVECPWCEPREGQYASATDHRFLCHKCFNAPVDGKWVRVRFPNRWAEIEGALLPRPTEARNWDWGIPPEQLLAENHAKGL